MRLAIAEHFRTEFDLFIKRLVLLAKVTSRVYNAPKKTSNSLESAVRQDKGNSSLRTGTN
jgi:hypothetical protein